MLGFFKKKSPSKIFAPLGGKAAPVSETPDPVFADKILGDGIVIKPDCGNNMVVSPVNGKIITAAETLHAFGIETDDGIELLLHIGINSVGLKGQGFENLVKPGDIVKVGTPICRVDWNKLKEKGCPSDTPLVVTNGDRAGKLNIYTGAVVAGESCVMEYDPK